MREVFLKRCSTASESYCSTAIKDFYRFVNTSVSLFAQVYNSHRGSLNYCIYHKYSDTLVPYYIYSEIWTKSKVSSKNHNRKTYYYFLTGRREGINMSYAQSGDTDNHKRSLVRCSFFFFFFFFFFFLPIILL